MSIEDLINDIQQQNFAQANNTFSSMMSHKMSDALDAESVRLANTIFNGEDPNEDEDVELDDEDFDDEIEEDDE